MKNQTLIKAFKEFAESAEFFEAPFSEQTLMQLITAIGHAEDKENPDLHLMHPLMEAVGVDMDSQDVRDCLEGNVY